MQAEVDELQAKLSRIETPKKRRVRRLVVALLVVLSCLLVMLSTTVVWAHRTVLNTTAFVNTVGPVFQHPEVDAAVATRATDQLFSELHLQSRLRNALPPKAGFVAIPVTAATQSFVSEQLAKVLGSRALPNCVDEYLDVDSPTGGGGPARTEFTSSVHFRRLHRPQYRSGDQQCSG